MESQENYEAALSGARTLMDDGAGIEAALRFMRNAGLSQIECVKAVKALTGQNLGAAKEIVHFSDTWSDFRPQQELLHKRLCDGLDEGA